MSLNAEITALDKALTNLDAKASGVEKPAAEQQEKNPASFPSTTPALIDDEQTKRERIEATKKRNAEKFAQASLMGESPPPLSLRMAALSDAHNATFSEPQRAPQPDGLQRPLPFVQPSQESKLQTDAPTEAFSSKASVECPLVPPAPSTKEAVAHQDSKEKNLGGYSQVTVVCHETCHTPDNVPQVVPHLSGALPHAPHPPTPKKKTRASSKDEFLKVRIYGDMKAKATEKASALGYEYVSGYILHLIAADLKMPVDEYETIRRGDLIAAFAELTVSWNRVGTNLNQITAAANKGAPCPFSRPELEQFRREWRELVTNTPKKLGLH